MKEMNKKKMKDFCGSADDLKAYLQEKAKNHNSYKCYSKMDYIAPMVKGQVMYLNNGKKWNDVTDRNNFNSTESQVNFGKCFSFLQDENVAMWMLYGGIYHTGAMVDFTKKGMEHILETTQIELGYFENKVFCGKRLLKRPTFDIWMTDIVYCNEKNGYMKRSDESCTQVSQGVFDDLGYCKKAYPWNYENECRLIVSIPQKEIPVNCDTVKIDLRNMKLGKSLSRAYYCPGYQGVEVEGFHKSKLDGTVEWDLREEKCKDCAIGEK